MSSTYPALFHKHRIALGELYDSGETNAIAREVTAEVTGLKYEEAFLSSLELTEEQEKRLESIISDILQGMPMQYALGVAYFMGKRYMVNKYVLIPRPETEELVQWISDDWKKSKVNRIELIDIGTGSGCIPISVKLQIPDAIVTALDVSMQALEVAKANAETLGADITLKEIDFLDENTWEGLSSYDTIASNPPYIPSTERATLAEHVREWEPGTALFVEDNDPLIFYRAIAKFGQTHLNEGGSIYCEIHTDYSAETKRVFEDAGYKAEVRKDMSGNWRMVKAWK